MTDQLTALLLELKSGGTGWAAFETKLTKTLAAFRTDDLFPRGEQLRLYLSLCPFGNLHGHEAIGIPAAARVFYGRDHSQFLDHAYCGNGRQDG